MSLINVNTIEPSTGTDITLGASGDTLTVPSGATIVNSGTATGFGDPGLTAAAMWRVTANFTGHADPIASNWEAADSYGAGNLGSAMTESSGIFTFPSTGFWLITYHMAFYANNGTQAAYAKIKTTTDNVTYTAVTEAGAFADQQGDTANTTQGSTDANKTSVSFLKLGDT